MTDTLPDISNEKSRAMRRDSAGILPLKCKNASPKTAAFVTTRGAAQVPGSNRSGPARSMPGTGESESASEAGNAIGTELTTTTDSANAKTAHVMPPLMLLLLLLLLLSRVTYGVSHPALKPARPQRRTARLDFLFFCYCPSPPSRMQPAPSPAHPPVPTNLRQSRTRRGWATTTTTTAAKALVRTTTGPNRLR